MLKRRGSKGLTLVEILLALIVMVLGVLGILALFPPAMESAKQSMEETNAAIFAESVAHGLKTSIIMSKWDDPSKTWWCRFKHDLFTSSAKPTAPGGLFPTPPDNWQFDFPLPLLKDGWLHYPGGVPAGDPATLGIFRLGDETAIKDAVDYVKTNVDPSDPMKQFSFSFDIKKINSVDYLINATPAPINPATNAPYVYPNDIEGLCKMYEFTIHVFRSPEMGPSVTSSGGSAVTSGTSGSSSMGSPNLIASFSYRVTGK